MSSRLATSPDEASLSAAMRAAQDGDAAAYQQLLRDCVPVIKTVVRRRGVQGVAVDDVVQEALLTIHRARATYDPARPFLPWLRAIAQRRAIDASRRHGRRPREVYEPLAYEQQADTALAAEDVLGEDQEAKLRAAVLVRAMESLPASQRQAVQHLSLDERSLAETSLLTGRSTGSLKVSLHRALKSLRAALGSDKERDDV